MWPHSSHSGESKGLIQMGILYSCKAILDDHWLDCPSLTSWERTTSTSPPQEKHLSCSWTLSGCPFRLSPNLGTQHQWISNCWGQNCFSRNSAIVRPSATRVAFLQSHWSNRGKSWEGRVAWRCALDFYIHERCLFWASLAVGSERWYLLTVVKNIIYFIFVIAWVFFCRSFGVDCQLFCSLCTVTGFRPRKFPFFPTFILFICLTRSFLFIRSFSSIFSNRVVMLLNVVLCQLLSSPEIISGKPSLLICTYFTTELTKFCY